MSTILTVTAKGQVTLRKDILEHLGIRPGDKISVDMLANGRLAMQAEKPKRDISELFGILHRPSQPVLSIEEINEAIAKGWAGEE